MILKGDRLVLGTCYYPEHWPEKLWRDDLRRMLEAGVTPDALLTDVEEALEALGELTGQSVREDIVDRIFQRFCVGK